MKDKSSIDELVKRLLHDIPENISVLKKDVEHHVRHAMSCGLEKLNLVNREEFDVQAGVLKRTREKLDRLEKEVKKLEERLETGASAQKKSKKG